MSLELVSIELNTGANQLSLQCQIFAEGDELLLNAYLLQRHHGNWL